VPTPISNVIEIKSVNSVHLYELRTPVAVTLSRWNTISSVRRPGHVTVVRSVAVHVELMLIDSM